MAYGGTGKTARAILALADGPRGAQSLRLRLTVEEIIRDVEPRDVLSQLAAIYNWYMCNSGYVWDPLPTELVRDPETVLDELRAHGKFLGDCDDAATFLTGAARSIGVRAIPIRVGFVPTRRVTLGGVGRRPLRVAVKAPYSHVLAVARDQYGRVVVLDPVAGPRTWRMLRRAKRAG